MDERDEEIKTLREHLEDIENFLIGVACDPRIPMETQEAIRIRAWDIMELLNKG